jgi:hypothetical protein
MTQLIPTLAVVASILGAAPAPSNVVVPRAERVSFNSVSYFDNVNEDAVGKSVTNAVLDRSIRTKAVRVHMDLQDPESFTNAERIEEMQRDRMRKTLAYAEEHCQKRFAVQKLPNASQECGAGKRGLANDLPLR